MKPSIVIFVADVPLITGFYGTLAGLQADHADGDHTILDLDGLELVIHATNAPGPGRIRTDAAIKLCLPVDSLAAARARVPGHVQGPEHEWDGPGYRACDGHDLEGNVFQIREPR